MSMTWGRHSSFSQPAFDCPLDSQRDVRGFSRFFETRAGADGAQPKGKTMPLDGSSRGIGQYLGDGTQAVSKRRSPLARAGRY